MSTLNIHNLHVAIGDKEILHGLSLKVKSGEIHTIMGPNGSGKSTLAYALMGHPSYEIKNQKSKIKINSEIISDMKPDERAKLGLFLAFQNPLPVAGVPVSSLLRVAYQSVKNFSFRTPLPGKVGMKAVKPTKTNGEAKMSLLTFKKLIEEKAELIGLDRAFLGRSLNEGFSGGEKKKVEMLQALVLEPKFVIFDEIDTGLDIDALQAVAKGIELLKKQGAGIVIITHYQRLLHHVRPDFVHILMNGKLVKSGTYSLAKEIEKTGYKLIH